MRKVLVLVLAITGFLPALALAQTDTGQAYVDGLTAIADALEGVHDEASAQAAAEKATAAIERLTPLSEEISAWPPSQKSSFYYVYREDIVTQHARISNSMQSLMLTPELFEMFFQQIRDMPRIE